MLTLESTPESGACKRMAQLYANGLGQSRLSVATFREDGDASLKRPAISPWMLTLPECASTGRNRVLVQAMTAHAVAHLRYSTAGREVGRRTPLLVAMLSVIEDARVEKLMLREYPGLHSVWDLFHEESASRHADGLSFVALGSRLSRAIHDARYKDGFHWVNKGRALFESKCADLEDSAGFEEVASILANDLGQMRVRFDASSYAVEPAYRDDNTYLWMFGDTEARSAALGAADDMKQESGRSETEGEGGLSTGEAAAAEVFHYPEWNYRNETWRADWVQVREQGPAGLRAEQPAMVRKTRIRLHPHWRSRAVSRRIKAQLEGDDLDLDALIAHAVSQRVGALTDGRVYAGSALSARDASILILLDLSESTARLTRGTGRTLLDEEKAAAHQILSDFDGSSLRIALQGFSSNGRHEVRYIRLKEFKSPYGSAHVQMLSSLVPGWSTRVGTALRHSGRRLRGERSSAKAVILVTDGEPSDIDVFDQRYLVEDARKAIEELRAAGIRCFCVNVDPSAGAVVSTIFGQRNCATVDNTARLPGALELALVRVTT
ncbi:nitric oxide reductase activation protein NorD [Paraburkholderia sp. DGU8]|uniref:nitric oxide reductase activation protein NorD n=1 Tax=Paraburkholderia sp. DGU8 TaxID=3161997 RepID=UPI0034653F4A